MRLENPISVGEGIIQYDVLIDDKLKVQDREQVAMKVLMSFPFEVIVDLFHHFCPKAKVKADDDQDYVKSNACRHLVNFLGDKWK